MAELFPVAALDMGTTRFRVVLAEADDEGRSVVMASASAPAQGLSRGKLVDLPRVAHVVRSLLSQVSREAGTRPHVLATSVGGDHVRSFAAHAFVPVEGRAGVGSEHLRKASQRAQSMGIPFDRVILHCLPVEYTLDGQRGLQNPQGMMGSRLELDAHVITGAQSALSALVGALEVAGEKSDVLVFGPCATSRFLISDAEREQGCLLIDIGGEVTHYALFYRGRMRQSGVVPLGGNHVTRDLAFGMEVTTDEAETLKRRYGVALRSRVAAGFEHESDGSIELEHDARPRVAGICEARQQEILERVAAGLQWEITRPALPAGIILAGGGSRLAGTAELAEGVFTLRAAPRRAPADDEGEQPDSWATALGLLHYAMEGEREAELAAAGAAGGGRVLNQVFRWFGKLV